MSSEEDIYARSSSSEPESEPGSYNTMDSDNDAEYTIPIEHRPPWWLWGI